MDYMFQTFQVYGKPDCGKCTEAKKMLNRYAIQYDYTSIGEDITVEEFKEQFPGILQMPYIVEKNTGKPLGHFRELVQYLKGQGVIL